MARVSVVGYAVFDEDGDYYGFYEGMTFAEVLEIIEEIDPTGEFTIHNANSLTYDKKPVS